MYQDTLRDAADYFTHEQAREAEERLNLIEINKGLVKHYDAIASRAVTVVDGSESGESGVTAILKLGEPSYLSQIRYITRYSRDIPMGVQNSSGLDIAARVSYEEKYQASRTKRNFPYLDSKYWTDFEPTGIVTACSVDFVAKSSQEATIFESHSLNKPKDQEVTRNTSPMGKWQLPEYLHRKFNATQDALDIVEAALET